MNNRANALRGRGKRVRFFPFLQVFSSTGRVEVTNSTRINKIQHLFWTIHCVHGGVWSAPRRRWISS